MKSQNYSQRAKWTEKWKQFTKQIKMGTVCMKNVKPQRNFKSWQNPILVEFLI